MTKTILSLESIKLTNYPASDIESGLCDIYGHSLEDFRNIPKQETIQNLTDEQIDELLEYLTA